MRSGGGMDQGLNDLSLWGASKYIMCKSSLLNGKSTYAKYVRSYAYALINSVKVCGSQCRANVQAIQRFSSY